MARRSQRFRLRRPTTVLALCALVFGGAIAAGPPTAAAAASTAPTQTGAVTPSALMPCSPPRPTFSGGTGAFHSDHFLSDYVTAPTLGAADVPNANFTNVFLWPDPSNGSDPWDTHAGSLGAPTRSLIDTMTQNLTCSSYFDLLTQYNINPPSFSGDEITIQPCVDAALTDAAGHNGVISWLGMGAFASCIHDHNPDNNSDQINIFLSPDLKASSFLQDGNDMCSRGVTGYHGGFSGFPSWTVIATNPSCNNGPGPVLGTLSHEMVELVSDPGGFGWKHDRGLDFNQTYSNGELGDICSGVGEFSAPSTVFPGGPASGPGEVAPYWSDQDAQCEPQFIMNDTIVPMFSTPTFSFPGTFVVPVSQTNGFIQALELEVATGSEDLGGGSSLQVTVDTKEGDHFLTDAVNEGTQWGSNTLHAALLHIPSGVSVSDISSITLKENGETWDVAGVSLQAAVAPSPPPCTTYPPTIVNDTVTHTLSDGTKGIVRMAGGSLQTFTEPVNVPAVDANLKVTALSLSIGTGGDDLDGGRKPEDNATAVVHLMSGRDVVIPNINRTAEWPNGQARSVDLLDFNTLPPSTVASDLASVSIVTNFPGGLGGKNWDITSVQLVAGVGCARAGAPPTLKDVTLANLNPGNTLPDGTTGLCRETGSVHSCLRNIPAVPPADASDIVTNLQMTITTGQDDLGCCDAPGNNANVVINSTNPASPEVFNNVNESQHFDNGTVFSFPLFAPPDPGGATPLTLGQLKSLDIQTGFGGFQPDNWDIGSVVLTATVAVGGCCGPMQPAAAAGRGLTVLRAPAASTTQPRVAPDAGVEPSAATAALSHWVVKASPNQGSVDNRLNAVSCVTPTDCVAVGAYGSEGGSTALIETWNGAAWTIAPTPNLGSPFSMLSGVSCSSANSCVAVGLESAGGSEGGSFDALAEIWNGTSWVVASPAASTHNTVFKSVSCPADNNCVAVGYLDKLETAQTLVETWKGGAWHLVSTPNRTGDNVLEGVSCWAVSKCTAVGVSGAGGLEQTLTLRWNGAPWTIFPSPDVGSSNNVLYGVSCVSAAKCVAVGDDALTTPTSAPLTRQTLVEVWDTGAWSVAPSPDPGTDGNVLDGVACTSATNCAAGGSRFNGSIQRTLVQLWDGTTWSNATTPNPGPTTNVLFGLDCSTPAGCAAVGTYANSSGVEQTLALEGSNATFTKVTLANLPANPKLTLIGKAFGASAPASTAAGCANTGRDYSRDALYVQDITGGWEAGAPGDCIGLSVSTYTATKIVTTFGSGYGQPPGSNQLSVGDQFVITVLGATCAGSVGSGTILCT